MINVLSTVKFSDREIHLLELIASDKSTKEIAVLLFLSPRTIESQKDVLRKKMGVKNTVGILMYAVRNKLIDINKIK